MLKMNIGRSAAHFGLHFLFLWLPTVFYFRINVKFRLKIYIITGLKSFHRSENIILYFEIRFLKS